MTTAPLEAAIDDGVRILRRGGVVAFPTDTLYGLGADGLSQSAVARVFVLKRRSLSQPLPLLLADPDDLDTVATHVPAVALELARAFWPGPLTIVVPRAPLVPDLVTAGELTVAVRVPRHDVPRRLARQLGHPLTGTSANLNGAAAPTTAAQVRTSLGSAVDLVIDGGPTGGDQPSTIVDVTASPPLLVRRGAIPLSRLREICPDLGQGSPTAARD